MQYSFRRDSVCGARDSEGGDPVTICRDMWVLEHPDWYTYENGKGYIPTEKAPPEAVEAINRLNEFALKKYGKH